MSKEDDKPDIREKLDKGWIQSRMIIEIVGKPKDHIEKTSKALAENLRSNDNIIVLNLDLEEAKELDDMKDFFGSFIEIECLLPDLRNLISFCFEYMPSSVEIIHPEEKLMKNEQISYIINELQTKLHNIGMQIKQEKAKNTYLTKNIHQLLENSLNLILKNSSHTSSELAKALGLPEDQMKDFLSHLLDKGKLDLSEDRYSLKKI